MKAIDRVSYYREMDRYVKNIVRYEIYHIFQHSIKSLNNLFYLLSVLN